jgi:DNA-binding response OmpR family regulator
MNNEKILIVDDDPKIIKLLQVNLKARGYIVSVARDGSEAIDIIQEDLPDLIILDLLMPKLDGREVCKQIRQWSNIPIIILSALGEVHDKVSCFGFGADDYMSKPFAIDELIARIKALLKRTKKQMNETVNPLVKVGGLEINFTTGIVSLSDKIIRLTSTEYRLLSEFALNQGKILTHEYLLSKIWGLEFRNEKEYLRVYINRLRKKIDPSGSDTMYIVTIPGFGYQFG